MKIKNIISIITYLILFLILVLNKKLVVIFKEFPYIITILIIITLLIILIIQFNNNKLKLFFLILNIFKKDNTYINKLANKYLNRLIRNKNIYTNIEYELISSEYIDNYRYLKIKYLNNNILSEVDVYKAIYVSLIRNKEFTEFSKDKVIITTATLLSGREFSLHHNIYFGDNLTLKDFLLECKESVEYLTHKNYFFENIVYITIKVWNISDYRNKTIKLPKYLEYNYKTKTIFKKQIKLLDKREFHTSINLNKDSNYITPLKSKNNLVSQIELDMGKKQITAMDIETICFKEITNKKEQIKRIQTPVLITCAYYVDNENIKSFYTLIDKKLLYDLDLAVLDLWKRFFIQFHNNIKWETTIFMHNLGSFDGYFLYSILLELNKESPNNFESVIDKDNRFIQISWKNEKNHLTWKDSQRIFPVSLDKLCETFFVDGKLSKYNPEFNNPNILNNNFKLNNLIDYALQDSISLLEALVTAQYTYMYDYYVDIASIWSTSTLSL
jgi:hypothetical protein